MERYNRTFLNMLKTLSQKEKSDWKSHLPKLAFAVNSTRNATTEFSPHFLLYGREAKLPIDEIFRGVFGHKPETDQCHEKFAIEWEKSMKQAYLEIGRV